MQRSSPVLALALAVTLATSGCYSVKYYVEDSPTPVEVTSGAGRFRYHFKEEGRNFFMIYGLLPVWGDKTDTLLSKHMVRGSRISNLKVTTQVGVFDFLLSAGVNLVIVATLTPGLGLMAPYVAGPLGLGTRTVTYEGDVIDDTEAGE